MTLDLTRLALDWAEASDHDNTMCVVAAPHDADPVRVGLIAARTEPYSAADPDPAKVTVKKTWGRLFTLGEMWQQERAEPRPVADTAAPDVPPDGWWPSEGTPAWAWAEAPLDGFEPIWEISWT